MTSPGDAAELGKNPVKEAAVVRRDLFRARTNSVYTCMGYAAELGKNPVKEADVVQRDLSELGKTQSTRVWEMLQSSERTR